MLRDHAADPAIQVAEMTAVKIDARLTTELAINFGSLAPVAGTADASVNGHGGSEMSRPARGLTSVARVAGWAVRSIGSFKSARSPAAGSIADGALAGSHSTDPSAPTGSSTRMSCGVTNFTSTINQSACRTAGRGRASAATATDGP